MLPYILKICGFKNSIVYTFYGVYQKYTVFVKLYICGLTYRLYIRYKHKLRIDVITYVPTPANDPPSATVFLLPLLSLRSQQYRVSRYRNIRTSGYGYPFYCAAAPVRSTSLWWWIPAGIPRWICGMGSLLGSAIVVGRSQQESADDVCGPAGEIIFF